MFSFIDDHDHLWESLDSQLLCGTKVKTFCPGNMLIILYVHGSYHLWGNIKWIADIAALLDVRKEIDWNLVLKKAKRLRSERILGLSLYLANNLLGSELPKAVNKFVNGDIGIKKLADKIIERLFKKREKKLSLNPMHIQMWKGWRERAKFCLVLFTLSPLFINHKPLSFHCPLL